MKTSLAPARRRPQVHKARFEQLEQRTLLSIGNPTGPSIAGITPALDDGLLPTTTESLTVEYGEPVGGGDEAANYRLQRLGPDVLLGTADDEIVSLASVVYSGNTATLTFDPLVESVYRLTISDTITDLVDQPLDGDADGTAGGDWVRDFVDDVPESPLVTSVATFDSGGVGPESVLVHDFNGDGLDDLAVCHLGEPGTGGNIVIFSGDGTGGFADPTTFDLNGFSGGPMAGGDLNNDGKTDLAIGNSEGQTLTLLLGSGDDRFADPTMVDTWGESPRTVEIVDLDDDQNADLRVTQALPGEPGRTVAYYNDGEAGFSGPVSLGDPPPPLASGDLDGDGIHEDYWAEPNANSVRATYTVTKWVWETHAKEVVIDGTIYDVPYLVWKQVSEQRTRTIHFDETRPHFLTIEDFTGDGLDDLVAVGTVSWGGGIDSMVVKAVWGGPDDSNRSIVVLDSPLPASVASGDFNGDGRGDLAMVGHDGNTVEVLLNSLELPAATMWGTVHSFDVDRTAWGAGQILQTTNNAADGLNRLQVGDTDYQIASPPRWDENYALITPDVNVSGLDVHREITALAGQDDCLRTVDVFHNPSSQPVTTTVRIVGNLGSDAETTVWTTSDGDQLVETTDQWIGTDDADGTGSPAVLHYVHGSLGLAPISISRTGDNVEWTYELTVSPGGTARLAHFTIVAETRAEAEASASNVVTAAGFTPVAAEFLTAEELSTIVNFDTPPVADAGGPYQVEAGNDLLLDGTASYDPDASPAESIVSYQWDVNDDGVYDYTGATVNVPWHDLQHLPQPGLPIRVTLMVEDSIVLLDPLIAGQTSRIAVTASDQGHVTGWIDWNRDGVWSTPEELVAATGVLPGENVIEVAVPSTAVSGETFMRFRFASSFVMEPTGGADDGEVEDYRVLVVQPIEDLGTVDFLLREDVALVNGGFCFQLDRTRAGWLTADALVADGSVQLALFDDVYLWADTPDGGHDVAKLHDSLGEDLFEATPDWARLSKKESDGSFDLLYEALGFERVKSYSLLGGPDKAILHDTPGDDLLEAKYVAGLGRDDTWAGLWTGEDNALRLLYDAIAFDQVEARSTTGRNTTDIATEVDFLMLDDGWEK